MERNNFQSITENNQSSMTLQELIEKLHVIFADDEINADEVQSVMESYTSQRNEWRKFASFDPYR